MAAKKKVEEDGGKFVDANVIGEIARIANALIAAEDAVVAANEEMKILTERVRRLREEDLPGAMAEAGMKKFELTDGSKIAVTNEVYVALTEETKPRAYQWLADHNFGGLIKTKLTCDFGREPEEKEKMEALAKALEQLEIEHDAKMDVHPATLKAWLKEQLAKGTDIEVPVPLDIFNARPVDVAKVARPKQAVVAK